MRQFLHIIRRDDLQPALQYGLHCQTQGEFSQEPYAAETNDLLDRYRPEWVIKANIGRNCCVYAYYVQDDEVHDIASGKSMPLAGWQKKYVDASHAVLWLSVPTTRAYVSDLAAYDAVCRAVQQQLAATTLHSLVDAYWQKFVPLTRWQASPHDDVRFEIMLAGDISATQLATAH